MDVDDFVAPGRRLQFGSFNQPIGFWVGTIIGGIALLTLLVFLFWYTCCFDTPRYIPKPESYKGSQSEYASVERNEVFSNNEEDEEGGGGGDGDGGDEGGDAQDGDEEGENGEDGRSGGGGGGEEEDGECKVVVTYDHCDLGQHAPEFKAAQRKAGLSQWTFSSLEGR